MHYSYPAIVGNETILNVYSVGKAMTSIMFDCLD